MISLKQIVLSVLVLLVASSTSWSGAVAVRDIPLSKVPDRVMKTARKAVPDIVYREAEIQKTSQGIVYELDGFVATNKYEVRISSKGEVLSVTLESDEPDDVED